MHCNFIEKKDSFDLSDPRFVTALQFLKRKDLDKLEDQVILLDNGVKALIQSYRTADASAKMFETHDRYYDIQYLISGVECIYVCDRKKLSIEVPYNEENDISFYKDQTSSDCVILQPGKYIFLDEDDAHKPGISYMGEVTNVRKVVIKIPIKG